MKVLLVDEKLCSHLSNGVLLSIFEDFSSLCAAGHS